MNTILANMLGTKTRRKVKSKYTNAPSEVELEEKFTGKSVLHQPEDTPWSKIINANIGKTIKPIEKWLCHKVS